LPGEGAAPLHVLPVDFLVEAATTIAADRARWGGPSTWSTRRR